MNSDQVCSLADHVDVSGRFCGWRTGAYRSDHQGRRQGTFSIWIPSIIDGLFIFDEFQCIPKHFFFVFQVRVYTPPNLANQGHFALDVAVKTLSFFCDYFGEPYPLPKMDLLAVPDFAAGAMENWGLVTYRTVYLLYEEGKSSLKAKQVLDFWLFEVACIYSLSILRTEIQKNNV